MAFCYADRAMKAPLPADIVTLQQALVAAQRHDASVEIRADEAEARAANVDAINADLLARNALLELQNAKMQRALYGPRSERSARLIAQLELAFEDLDTDATEAERRAALAAAKTMTVAAFMRRVRAGGATTRPGRSVTSSLSPVASTFPWTRTTGRLGSRASRGG